VVVVDGSPGLVDRRGGTVVVVEVEDGWGGATGFKNGGRSGIVARDVKAATGVSIITDVRMVFRSSFILNGGRGYRGDRAVLLLVTLLRCS